MNIDESLVMVRVGSGMIERRGGISYFIKYRKARKRILDTGFISYFDFVFVNAIQLVVTLIPDKVRALIFEKFFPSEWLFRPYHRHSGFCVGLSPSVLAFGLS